MPVKTARPKRVVKPKVVKEKPVEQKVEELYKEEIVEEVKNAPVPKELMVDVYALMGYSNGSIEGCSQWRSGETRKIPFRLVKLLENDLPGNWKVIFPKPENA